MVAYVMVDYFLWVISFAVPFSPQAWALALINIHASEESEHFSLL